MTATAPAGLEPGSPFGNSFAAVVVHLHYAHAIGIERLALLMDELFSLSISEGAINRRLSVSVCSTTRGPRHGAQIGGTSADGAGIPL